MSSRKSSICNLYAIGGSAFGGQSSILSALLAAGMLGLGTMQAYGKSAIGGTVTNYPLNGTNFNAHIFTNSVNETLTTNITFDFSGNVEVLVVAGGGGGGNNTGGGGGAGGYIYSNSFPVVKDTSYPVQVGKGGPSEGKGDDSKFATVLTADGGGGGNGGGGGSGGGGQQGNIGGTATFSASQGNDGGASKVWGGQWRCGGGGGAGTPGTDGTSSLLGHGGVGKSNDLSGVVVWYAGGGGGGTYNEGVAGIGGQGGGGNGGYNPGNNASNGVANTGGGGGGQGQNNGGGASGGSGIVIVRYWTALPTFPIIANNNVTDVTTISATFNGTLTETGGADVAVCVLWGDADGGATWNWANTNWLTPPAGGWTNNSPLSINITSGINADDTYWYTFAATNATTNKVAVSSKSFITGPVTVLATDGSAQYPGDPGQFTIFRPAGCTNIPLNVAYTMSGTATNGTHYTISPASPVTVDAGATSRVVTVTPTYLGGGNATLTLTSGTFNYPVGASPNNSATVSISAYLHTPITVKTVQAGYWTNATTWNSGLPPFVGDSVIVEHAVTLDSSTLALASCSNAATITFLGTNAALNATAVIVNGTITHLAQTDTAGPWEADNRVWMVCSNLTVAVGGKIDVKYKGYAGGTSGSRDGKGPGGGGAGDSGAGGGYGGRGRDSSRGNPGGAIYGVASAPADPGSGGGSDYFGNTGGAGGGLVTIEATGAVKVDGEINANGEDGGTQICGAGSGGGIFITCGTLEGSGLVCANGGMGASEYSTYWGGSAGGRIAIVVTDTAAQGSLTSPKIIVARGPAPSEAGAPMGDSGTIYASHPSGFPIVFSGGAALSSSVFDWTPASLTFSNGTYTITQAPWEIAVTGNLLLTNAAALQVFAAATNGTGKAYGARILVGGNLDVHDGCAVYPVSHPTDGGSVRFDIGGNLTIHSGGSLDGEGKGYGGGPAGNNQNGYGPGLGTSGNNIGGGGGYGGAGGPGYYNNGGGGTYGSSNAPAAPGSGGAGGNNGDGTAGGGLIWIRARGAVTVNGTMSANGGASATWGSCGSGGGVWIACRTFQGAGTISAAGGNNTSWGGGGGGGRIAIWDKTDSPDLMDEMLAKNTAVTVLTLQQYKDAYDTFDSGSLNVTGGNGYVNGVGTVKSADGTAYFFIPKQATGTLILLR